MEGENCRIQQGLLCNRCRHYMSTSRSGTWLVSGIPPYLDTCFSSPTIYKFIHYPFHICRRFLMSSAILDGKATPRWKVQNRMKHANSSVNMKGTDVVTCQRLTWLHKSNALLNVNMV